MILPIVRVGNVKVPLPEYKTQGAVGLDLSAALEEPLLLLPHSRVRVPTGISIALPEGFEAQVRPRSGLSNKFGVIAIHGTIDWDYRGEIMATMINLDATSSFWINPLDRIAQLVICPVVQAILIEVEQLEATERGAAGYGSTGLK